ncbi:MAG: hypothetical protein WCP70_09575 [Methanothrix sp.]
MIISSKRGELKLITYNLKHKIMAAWVVRAGRNGEDEQLALDKDLVCIRWIIPHDLSRVTDKKQLYIYAKEEEPFASEGRLHNSVGQLYSFVHRIENGDFVILPRKETLKTTRTIAVGRALSYEYRSDLKSLKDNIALYQTRRVKWLDKDLPRSELDDETLKSINLPSTVFRLNLAAEDAIVDSLRKRGVT